MFTRHRLALTDKLDCPHAMGTDAFSRIMIPRLPLRLRSGLRQRRDFGSGRRRPLGASTFCCYHRRRRFTTDASRRIFESALERVRRSFRLHVYGYVVMPEHVHLLLSEPQEDTSSDRTAPLKPKAGLNGPSITLSALSRDT